MSLRPARDVQKVLISTTSRLEGEFETDNLVITHAYPNTGASFGWARMSAGPMARNAFVVSVRAEQQNPAPGIVIPNYDYVGDTCCRHLSLLYGKRFDNHGAIEGSGLSSLPDLSQFSLLSIPELPQNSHLPRADIATPLNLTEARRLLPLWFGKEEAPAFLKFDAACKFYLRALQAAERDPESAYLNLISAGELLAAAVEKPKDVLLDDEIKGALARVEAEMENGKRVAGLFRGRMRQLKRGFVYSLTGLVDEAFFGRGEAEQPYARLKAPDFSSALEAAYDLRSRYLHAGTPFGIRVGPSGRIEEVQTGRPLMADAALANIIAMAPTYIGLERSIRYCLLRFAAETLGLDLEGMTQQST